jgi:hypothetical protein
MKRSPPKASTAKRAELLLTGQLKELQKIYIADMIATVQQKVKRKKK